MVFWFYQQVLYFQSIVDIQYYYLRTDAEQLLIACKVNALLVRTSSMQGCYAVSTYDCTTPGKHYFIHYLVLFDEAKGGFKLEESPSKIVFTIYLILFLP